MVFNFPPHFESHSFISLDYKRVLQTMEANYEARIYTIASNLYLRDCRKSKDPILSEKDLRLFYQSEEGQRVLATYRQRAYDLIPKTYTEDDLKSIRLA